MIRYFIAYKEKDGREFCGNTPWITPHEAGFSDKESALLEQELLIKDGYLDVIAFEADMDNKPEEFSWEYVKKHKI